MVVEPRSSTPTSPAATGVGPLLDRLERQDPDRFRKIAYRTFDAGLTQRPGFSASWVQNAIPEGAEQRAEYRVGLSRVRLFKLPHRVETLYHLEPYEYQIPQKRMQLVRLAIAALQDEVPEQVDLLDPRRARTFVLRRGERLLFALARRHDIDLGTGRLEETSVVRDLAQTLARYSTGLGVMETLLRDKHIQDVYVDAPAADNLVYVTLGGLPDEGIFPKARTNVILGAEDVAALLSRFRYQSGRPFSEAMPVLETDLEGFHTRVTAIGRPLSPHGTAFALRRHSTAPWTLLRLIVARSLDAAGAGLLSLLVDGRSTILVAGSRGAGKTALLGALMLELPPSQRILTIEDTLELPGREMQEHGYKVQQLFVQSALGGRGQMTADDALRVSLRLGESAIVLGEVRGPETRTLYEAMRAGQAGSAVLGTIHGESPRSIYERVVHDLGIPARSFAATDIVVIAGLTRPGGRQHPLRRVLTIAELDPLQDGVFHDLMLYSPKVDRLVATDHLQDSIRLKRIASDWGVDVPFVLATIEHRTRIRQYMVTTALEDDREDLLQAAWVVRANTAYWDLVEQGSSGEDLMGAWEEWFLAQGGRGG